MNNSALIDRNKQIYQDRVIGMTYRQLMAKYNLALSRLQVIVAREQQKEAGSAPSQPEQLTVEQIKSKATPILQSAGATRAAVFGSYARGDNRADSDVDILVELPKGLSLLDVVGIKLDLEEELNRSVDLVEYHTVKPRMRDNVLESQIPIL